MRTENEAFFALVKDWWEPVWRGCFALVLDGKAAHQAAYRTFLQLGAAQLPDSREAQELALLRHMVRICEDHYYRKPRHKPKREALDKLPFPVDDGLCAFFQCSFSRRAAFWVHYCMEFSMEDTARILGASPRRAARLAKLDLPYTPEVIKKSAGAVRPPKEEEELLTDELLVRLDENFVQLEMGARRFKSTLDRAVPWIALGLVMFGAAAALYSVLRLTPV